MRRWARPALVGGAVSLLGLALALHSLPGTPASAAFGSIVEFGGLSGNRVPEAIVAGPDGNLWFTESQSGGAIGRITPAGVVTEFAVPTSNSGPFWITQGSDGNLWFTESFGDKIGRITPGGTVTEFAVPTANSGPNQITRGPDGNLWFTEFSGDTIAKISTSGSITEVAHLAAGTGPTGITTGSDGNLWFDEQTANKIGKITPAGVATDVATLASSSTPASITAGPDGNLWFTEFDGNKVAKITTGGTLTEFGVPTLGSQPGTVAVGPDGNLWFTEQTGNKIGQITTAGVITQSGPIPTPASGPGGIAAGPDGNIWFVERIGDKIGRLALAAPATCDDVWIGGVDNNFGTVGNWSGAHAPGPGDNACIDATTQTFPTAVADTYTVVLNGSFSVRSLTLGGPNGTQTLVIASSSTLNVGAASTVNRNGVLTLGDAGSGNSSLLGCGGTTTLTNSGHLNAIVGGGGNRAIQFVNFLNPAGGTVDVSGPLIDDGCGTTTNNGTFIVEVGGSLLVTNGPSFTNSGGSLANHGSVTVSGSLSTFAQRGGTETGNPVMVSNSTLDDDLGAAAGQFKLTGNSMLTGSGANPGVAAGQVVTIASSSTATVPTALVNDGTLTLGDAGSGNSSLLGCGATITLTNNGHLNAIAGGNRAIQFVNLLNAAGGTVDASGPMMDDNCGSISNDGTFLVEAGGSLSLSGGPSFTNRGGSLTNLGTVTVSGASPAAFVQRGGTETGNPVMVSNSTLDDDVGAAAGQFKLTANSMLTGSGANPGVAAGQVVTIASSSTATVPTALVNDGTLTLGDAGSGNSSLLGCGATITLTNNGHLNAIAGGNRAIQFVNLLNAAGGTVDVSGPLMDDNCGSISNDGTFLVEAGGSLSLSGGPSFTNRGGSLTNLGTVTVSGTSPAAFVQRGGTETGNPVVISNSAFDDDRGAGPGLFNLTGNSMLTGSGANPGVAAGQVVTIASSSTVAVPTSLANDGTLTLGDAGSGNSSLLGCGPVTLTNNGHFNAIAGGGGNRAIQFFDFINTLGGTVDVSGPLMDDNCGTITNNGTFAIEAGGSLSLSGGPTFSQSATGTFVTTINASTGTFGVLAGGGDAIGLDGKLRVATVGSPAVGSTWAIIASTNRSGQFATYDFGAINYAAQYPAGGVTLVVQVPLGDASINATAAPVVASEGSTFSGTVATFTDPDAAATASEYSATIAWGDGSSSAGTITGTAGKFTVSGTHTFAEEGLYGMTVTVSDTDTSGNTAAASGTATVSDAPLSASGVALTATEGSTTGSVTLATFSDAAPGGAASDYTATISWGDGAITTGTVTGTGPFSVTGSHTYTEDGTFGISVVIFDGVGSSVTAASSANVGDPSVAATGGLTLTSTEGAMSTNQAVATFTDPGGPEAVGDYGATIVWGDGSSSPGAITVDSAGVFTVSGAHRYAEEGSPSVSVAISHESSAAVAVGSSANVGDPAVVLTPLALSGVEGLDTGVVTVATFTDPAGSEAVGDYSASIAWGDGSTSPGTITLDSASGKFSVTGHHIYLEEGSDTVGVTVTHDSAPASSSQRTATIADAPLTAVGAAITGTEGAQFSGRVASLSDADPSGVAGDYTATIDWGDGTTSAATIAANGAGFDVNGSHRYAEEGGHAISVKITDVGGSTATATSSAAVGDAVLTASGTTFTVKRKTTFTHVVARFTDADPAGIATDYRAVIDWGDGTTSAGTIAANGAGGFDVTGTHRYQTKGTRTVTVTITDAGGSSAAARTTIKVANKGNDDEDDDGDDDNDNHDNHDNHDNDHQQD